MRNRDGEMHAEEGANRLAWYPAAFRMPAVYHLVRSRLKHPKLAAFWDTHDSTDFEYELEEVAKPVFVRGTAIEVPLESREVEAVERMARAKGVSREELLRAWVLQKLARRDNGRPTER